ncbi:hypothetical protein Pmar_PMAR010046 [Perkinsus marinus ATCC 50983]|uniref:Uncharacterized protein n=1 Tax=Perkinsus marinus (strain ATCC 50983 / TXsc) TaxID=423536 RepID=C5K4P0_PERM5|nr:hypothetical protein Pmar_PMAR010046 [Perkinsus marinus ATCC 50983]EER20312.1 hypothetical protein Pmar_PMAR010046 [Perkinsus marinus ATCC 50983]|eukprot:XP_002788516.1 hypothetical protein Pmar_PMAR010046 [Perkinsus marinus ATCC 50983]
MPPRRSVAAKAEAAPLAYKLRYCDKDSISPIYTVRSVARYCPFRGCQWDGKHGDLEAHMGDCDCDPSRVPDFLKSSSLDDPEGTVDGVVMGGALG